MLWIDSATSFGRHERETTNTRGYIEYVHGAMDTTRVTGRGAKEGGGADITTTTMQDDRHDEHGKDRHHSSKRKRERTETTLRAAARGGVGAPYGLPIL